MMAAESFFVAFFLMRMRFLGVLGACSAVTETFSTTGSAFGSIGCSGITTAGSSGVTIFGFLLAIVLIVYHWKVPTFLLMK